MSNSKEDGGVDLKDIRTMGIVATIKRNIRIRTSFGTISLGGLDEC